MLMPGSEVVLLSFLPPDGMKSVPSRSLSTATLEAGVVGAWDKMAAAASEHRNVQSMRDELAETLLVSMQSIVFVRVSHD